MRMRYGVSIVVLKSYSFSATVIRVLYLISWQIGLHYNGTWLFLLFPKTQNNHVFDEHKLGDTLFKQNLDIIFYKYTFKQKQQ